MERMGKGPRRLRELVLGQERGAGDVAPYKGKEKL